MRGRALFLSFIFLGLLAIPGRAVDPTPTPAVPEQFVTVTIRIGEPKQVPWTLDSTLMQAVIAVDGLIWGGRTAVLTRGKERTRYDFKKIRQNPELDPKLQPGDLIEVPQPIF